MNLTTHTHIHIHTPHTHAYIPCYVLLCCRNQTDWMHRLKEVVNTFLQTQACFFFSRKNTKNEVTERKQEENMQGRTAAVCKIAIPLVLGPLLGVLAVETCGQSRGQTPCLQQIKSHKYQSKNLQVRGREITVLERSVAFDVRRPIQELLSFRLTVVAVVARAATAIGKTGNVTLTKKNWAPYDNGDISWYFLFAVTCHVWGQPFKLSFSAAALIHSLTSSSSSCIVLPPSFEPYTNK